jgi:hypothetical protein
MYIDPNTGGMLFQALAAAFALLSGIALVFSRQIRAALARFRRFVREAFQDGERETTSGQATCEDTDRRDEA